MVLFWRSASDEALYDSGHLRPSYEKDVRRNSRTQPDAFSLANTCVKRLSIVPQDADQRCHCRGGGDQGEDRAEEKIALSPDDDLVP